ncbi:MAG: hypothetical protein NC293_14235 [Roseburia sp.]|nr:hypothetical protein [Roseburia sp.]
MMGNIKLTRKGAYDGYFHQEKQKKGETTMYEQLDIFSIIPKQEYPKEVSLNKRLNIGDYIGRIVLGEIEKGRITQIVGNDIYFFYRTDKGCFSASDRTDFK